ncbi:hypothetical protein [Candidatus Leptofilum sp.]|uniref:hypothetical protein n=1 Tax=Candidatus Leptofilum sp. TaxID=3241576 RepID=UPI003B5C1F83
MTVPIDMPITDIPIACDLTDEALVNRRQSIFASLWHLVEEEHELNDGYAFRFPGTEEIAQEVIAFSLAERQCCAFFQIELVFTPGQEAIWLRLRGGSGVKNFIKSALTVS